MTALAIISLLTLIIFPLAIFALINENRFHWRPLIAGNLIGAIIAIAIFIAYHTGVFNLPYAIAQLKHFQTPQTLLSFAIAIILYQRILEVRFKQLKSAIAPAAIIAIIGTCVRTAVIGSGLFFIAKALSFPLPYGYALLVGAALSATDPSFALGSLIKRRANKKLIALIATEAPLNNLIALIIFTVIAGVTLSQRELSWTTTPMQLGLEILGGMGLGVITGFLGQVLLAAARDHHLKILISFSLLLLTWVAAAWLSVSAPMAILIMGIIFSYSMDHLPNLKPQRSDFRHFWEYATAIAIPCLFAFIALQTMDIAFTWKLIPFALVILALTVISRMLIAALIIPLGFIGKPIHGGWRTLGIAGMHSALPIAIALHMHLPDQMTHNAILLGLLFTVIISVILQGMTTPIFTGMAITPAANPNDQTPNENDPQTTTENNEHDFPDDETDAASETDPSLPPLTASTGMAGTTLMSPLALAADIQSDDAPVDLAELDHESLQTQPDEATKAMPHDPVDPYNETPALDDQTPENPIPEDQTALVDDQAMGDPLDDFSTMQPDENLENTPIPPASPAPPEPDEPIHDQPQINEATEHLDSPITDTEPNDDEMEFELTAQPASLDLDQVDIDLNEKTPDTPVESGPLSAEDFEPLPDLTEPAIQTTPEIDTDNSVSHPAMNLSTLVQEGNLTADEEAAFAIPEHETVELDPRSIEAPETHDTDDMEAQETIQPGEDDQTDDDESPRAFSGLGSLLSEEDYDQIDDFDLDIDMDLDQDEEPK